MGHIDKFIVTNQIRGCKTELFQILKKYIRVHDPHDHLLSKGYRYGRNPYLHLNTAFFGFNSSILGPSLFCHVQPGQVFYPADNGGMNILGKLMHGIQNAVNTHPNQAYIPFGLDMNVTGPLIKSVCEKVVHGIHHMLIGGRKFVCGFQPDILFKISQINRRACKLVFCCSNRAFEAKEFIYQLNNVGF